ncbi:MAG: hypothetical protein LBM09_01020 [Candidatus Nomurabacteria bacterium]|jgi:hypothetical protein|nr:hypothetical protein [Candidatus Nomurabacteria bacterium]
MNPVCKINKNIKSPRVGAQQQKSKTALTSPGGFLFYGEVLPDALMMI